MELKESYVRGFRKPLRKSLQKYASLLGGEVEFQEFPDFILTPDKPNSARTVVPVTFSGEEVGKMYVIVFSAFDGTGDDKTYGLGDVKIPLGLKWCEKPERVIPRSKEGVMIEGFFPLFSKTPYGTIAPFAAHLDELTLDGNEVIPAWRLGQNKRSFLNAISRSRSSIRPEIQFTTKADFSGRRFGDPHAVYYGSPALEAVQVAGFLSITDQDNPLMSLAHRWRKPLKYE